MSNRKPSRRIMRRFKINEISGVDIPAQQGAVMTLLKRRMTKRVGEQRYFPDDFAYVGDEQKPDTWHLLLTDRPNGEPTRKRVDTAIAKLGGMMEDAMAGQPSRYHIPDDALDSIVDKLREAWSKAYPHKAPADMPDEIAPTEGDPMAMAEDEDEMAVDENGDPIEDEEVDPEAEPTEDEDVDPAAAAEEDDEEPRAKKPGKRPPPFKSLYGRRKKPGKKPVPEGDHAGTMGSFAMGKLGEAICKYYYVDPSKGAQSFADVLAECKKEEQYREVMEVAYPILNSLDGSLRSIVADKNLDTPAKQTMMRGSVEGFLAAIREEWPEVEEVLEKVLLSSATEGDESMQHLRKNAGAVSGDTKALTAKVDDLTKRLDDQSKAIEKANKERDEALAKAAAAEAVGKFDTDTRKFYDGLKDDGERAEFLKMDSKAQAKLVAKSKDDDETIEFDGETISKSAVGSVQFGIFKRMAAKQAKLEKQAAEEREARLDAEYLAQAEDEMPHLPGTAAEKAAVLRAIDEGIEDEDVRNTLAKMLSVGDKMVGKAFDRLGSSDATIHGNDSERAEKRGTHEFEKRITAIKARDNCNHTTAMQRARDEAPDEFEDWQSFGNG